MRRSRKILLGLALALILAVGGFAVWVWEPWNRVTENNFERIRRGMTVGEVEAILGKADMEYVGGWGDGHDIKIWRGGGNQIQVHFNPGWWRHQAGQVFEKEYFPFCPMLPATGTLREKIRTWLWFLWVT